MFSREHTYDGSLLVGSEVQSECIILVVVVICYIKYDTS